MIDSLIISGDSYSASFSDARENEGKRYGEHLADILNVPVTLLAKNGSSNPRIIRSITESVLDSLKQNTKPLVIVGLSFVRRIEIWYYGDNPVYRTKFLDREGLEDHQVLPMLTLDWVLNEKEFQEKYKSYIIADSFVHQRLVEFYTSVFGLIQFLENSKVPFLIFSAADNTDCPINCFPAIERLNIVQSVVNHTNVIDLHKFCVSMWGLTNDNENRVQTGHLSRAGHQKFANFLLTTLKERHILDDLL